LGTRAPSATLTDTAAGVLRVNGGCQLTAAQATSQLRVDKRPEILPGSASSTASTSPRKNLLGVRRRQRRRRAIEHLQIVPEGSLRGALLQPPEEG
jgi:hypothetical protein